MLMGLAELPWSRQGLPDGRAIQSGQIRYGYDGVRKGRAFSGQEAADEGHSDGEGGLRVTQRIANHEASCGVEAVAVDQLPQYVRLAGR